MLLIIITSTHTHNHTDSIQARDVAMRLMLPSLFDVCEIADDDDGVCMCVHHDTHTEAVSQSVRLCIHSLTLKHTHRSACLKPQAHHKQARQAVRSEASLAPLLSHQARQAGSDITAILIIIIRSLDVR